MIKNTKLFKEFLLIKYMNLEVKIKEENFKIAEISKLLESARKDWKKNRPIIAVESLKIAREFYESLNHSNNGKYKYLKEKIINTIEELNEVPVKNYCEMKPNELEKRLVVTLNNLKEFIKNKEPEKINEELRETIVNNIIKAGNYYRELTRFKGKNYRIDLLKEINDFSDKFLNYES